MARATSPRAVLTLTAPSDMDATAESGVSNADAINAARSGELGAPTVLARRSTALRAMRPASVVLISSMQLSSVCSPRLGRALSGGSGAPYSSAN